MKEFAMRGFYFTAIAGIAALFGAGASSPSWQSSAPVSRVDSLEQRVGALTEQLGSLRLDLLDNMKGSIMAFAGDQPPDGWLICDGRRLRDLPDAGAVIVDGRYGRLASTLGLKYSLPGETEPRLPDFRSRTAVGASAGDSPGLPPSVDQAGRALSVRPLGARTGEEVHILTEPELPAHSHDEGIDNASTQLFGVGPLALAGSPRHFLFTVNPPGQPNVKTFGFVPRGSNQPHNNMQPILTVNYIIRY